MTENRKLVGRRFEDFTRHQILLELTLYESMRQEMVTDVRYQSLLDRRSTVRRIDDLIKDAGNMVFQAGTSSIYLSNLLESLSNDLE